MDCEVGAAALLLVGQAYAEDGFGDRVEHEAGRECVGREENGANQLAEEADAAETAKRFEPENAARDTAPQAAEAVSGQTPSTSSIFSRSWVIWKP